ncbi:hypothetical protein CPB97_004320 [Podila verticillata]|nr:hypothetical protein CPB97_004320 [Podila verticillata]
MKEELMLTRRQKTLSNISNFMPLHIVLNEPVGVKFSITVPKFFTVEQLARQIEAEYAYLVEREIGHSRFPVIECGALFDHLEPEPKPEPDSKNRRARQRARNNKSTLSMPPSQPQTQTQTQSQSPQRQGPSTTLSDKNPDVDESYDINDNNEHTSGDSDSEQDTFPDEWDEQESRGVQLRFSDIVADVLDRDSTVHVVNIDQGMCICMWHGRHSRCG